MQSKIPGVSFSIEFNFKTKIVFFLTRVGTLTHSFAHTFSQLIMAPNLLWKGPHIHISSVTYPRGMKTDLNAYFRKKLHLRCRPVTLLDRDSKTGVFLRIL